MNNPMKKKMGRTSKQMRLTYGQKTHQKNVQHH